MASNRCNKCLGFSELTLRKGVTVVEHDKWPWAPNVGELNKK